MKYDGLIDVLMRHEREHIIDAIMVSLRSFADVLGCSSRHVNFEDGGIEYVLVLHEVEEGRHWSEYKQDVVRCKDCRHYDKGACWDQAAYGRCWREDDYCSYGERRK